MILKKYKGRDYIAILRFGEEPTVNYSFQITEDPTKIRLENMIQLYEQVNSAKVIPLVINAVRELNKRKKVCLDNLLG